MSGGKPKPLTQAQMRQVTDLSPEWLIIWAGADVFPEHEHLCTSPPGPGGTHRSEWVRVRYAPTGTPGVQAAKCGRCRVAWVRAMAG